MASGLSTAIILSCFQPNISTQSPWCFKCWGRWYDGIAKLAGTAFSHRCFKAYSGEAVVAYCPPPVGQSRRCSTPPKVVYQHRRSLLFYNGVL